MTPYGATDVGSTPRPDQTSPLQTSPLHTSPAHTMAPAVEDLPDVLPTDRLNARGMATPAWRDELRRIPNVRNGFTVVGALAQSFGVVIAAAWINTWWSYLIAFVLMTRGHVCLNILAHEAAHRLLFTESPAQRQRRPLAAGLPHVPGDARLSPRPLRAPSRRDGPGRTRPRAVRRLPHPEGLVASQAEARRVSATARRRTSSRSAGPSGRVSERRSRSSPCRR